MKKRILIAPLNWGLGHAARCIPIIRALLDDGFEPIIGSDGMALRLLKEEFPELLHVELASYNIKYAKKSNHLKFKLIWDFPKILNAIKTEKKQVQDLIDELQIAGIISDNRLGVYNKNVPSVYISHQLKVMSGNTTWLSSKLHQNFINKFDECWVPDVEDPPGLSGDLGHEVKLKIPLKYLGIISRFQKKDVSSKRELLVLLSGPEPQRSILEEKLLYDLQNVNGEILFVRGKISEEKISEENKSLKIINYLTSHELEQEINASRVILSRSGYTTILDLAKLQKKAFFIPTPGQYEQEYLAEFLNKSGIIPSCKQSEFGIDQLNRVQNYSGFQNSVEVVELRNLFGLFKGE